MRSRPTADAEAMKFRAPTLEEAVEIAEEALGGRVKVLEANRIRRGGIGGFFATDLGVEVSVVPEDESIEEALERLVAESDADERRHWQRRSSSRSATRTDEAALSPSPVRIDPEMLVPEPAEPEISMSALRAMATLQLDDQPPVPRAARRLRPSTELVSAVDIVEELRVLAERDATLGTPAAQAATAPAPAPAAATAVLAPEAPRVVPATPAPAPAAPEPRSRKLASPTPERPVAVQPEPTVARSPAPAPAPAPVRGPATAPATRTERVVRGDDGPAVITTEAGTALEVLTPNEVEPMPVKRSTAAPSRRHVELTIAAADQLIDSLSRNGTAQRLSVRVVLRSGDQREVEAEAHWEAPSAIDRRNVTEVG